MGKKIRGLRDGSGPYSNGVGRRKLAGEICPFDKESKENIKDMELDIDVKREVKIVSDKIGKGRFIK